MQALLGSETPEKHVISAWDWVTKNLAQIKQVVFVAHSEGGRLLIELLRRRRQSMCRLVVAAAMADSVHQHKQVAALHPSAQSLMRANFMHWVASAQALNEKDSRNGAPYRRGGCCCRSAGTLEHALTAGTALQMMLRWLWTRAEAQSAQNASEASAIKAAPSPTKVENNRDENDSTELMEMLETLVDFTLRSPSRVFKAPVSFSHKFPVLPPIVPLDRASGTAAGATLTIRAA